MAVEPTVKTFNKQHSTESTEYRANNEYEKQKGNGLKESSPETLPHPHTGLLGPQGLDGVD